MRTTLIASALCCLLAVPGFAKTYQLPDANPAVSVTLPNAWKPTEVEKGVEATSPDEETYVALETATAKTLETLITDDIKFLTEQGVVIDRSTQQTHDTTMNGIPVSFLRWAGKDKDGPTNVTLGIFGITDNLVLLMTAWSSPAGEKLYDKQITDIVSSIKRR
jgi:hypothetical protein